MAPQTNETKLALIQQELGHVRKQLETIDEKVSDHYVTKEEHENTLRRIKLLEKIVYTAAGVILLAVLTAIVNGVVGS